MFTLRKANSESGFMSVESIANALFYLIMIAVVTLVASKVMQSGKMATTLSALSMLRSNIQYVGVNAGGYADVGGATGLVLEELIPGLVKPLATAAPGSAVLPTGQTLVVAVSGATDPDENGVAIGAAPATNNYFRMMITAPSDAECRKLAYYGLGAGYGVMIDTTIVIPGTTPVQTVEGACTGGVNVVLTSR